MNNLHLIEDKQFNSSRRISFLYRSTFLRITFSLILILFKSNISFAQCSECLTNLLPLNTGFDYEHNTLYNLGEQDQYWQLTQGAGGIPYPRCATALHASDLGSFGSSKISINSTASADGNMNMSMLGGNCVYTGTGYIFRRDFCVNTGPGNPQVPGNLNIVNFANDLNVSEIVLVTPSGGITISNACWPNGVTNSVPTTALNFETGNYYLYFKVCNDWDWVPSLWPPPGSWSGQTGMSLEVQAFLTAGPNIFVDNNHYGKNTMCFAGYPSAIHHTIFKGQCIDSGMVDTITIVNYHPDLNYTISSNGSFLTDSTFLGVNNTQYIITVSDTLGCSLSDTLFVTNNLPHLVFADSIFCTNKSTPTNSVHISGTGGFGSYVFMRDSTYTFTQDSILLPPGQFNFTITDSIGCSTTDSMYVVFIDSIYLKATPDEICNGDSAVLVLLPITPFLTYPGTLLPFVWAPVNLSGQINLVGPTSTTTYTCYVSNSFGCVDTATTTITVNQNPIVSIASDNAPCTVTFTALSNNNPATFAVDNAPIIPLGNNQFTGNLTYPVTSRIYTVTATDANGCEGTNTVLYNQNPFCCGTSNFSPPQLFLQPQAKKFSSNPLWGGNGTATNVATAFGSNTITTSDPIIFDGNIVIDQDLNFINCPQIYFTPEARMMLQGANRSLSFDNCILQSECGDVMWKGISTQNDPSQSIGIKNSTLRDMEEGVVMSTGARIRCQFSQFENNKVGIQLVNAPANYNTANLNCIIVGNNFSCTGNYLAYPSNNVQRGVNGIKIMRCAESQIGALNGGVSPNTFSNLYNGIEIQNDNSAIIANHYLYNNLFQNIKFETTLNGNQTSELVKIQNWANSLMASRGCCIYSKGPLVAQRCRVWVDYDDNNGTLHFLNSDKAVMGAKSSYTISHSNVSECLMGFMFDGSDGQYYDIIQNRMEDEISKLMYGIYINGAAVKSHIQDNRIYLRMQYGINNHYPLGITFQTVNNTLPQFAFIQDNVVNINTKAGVGIYLLNTNSGVNVLKNFVGIHPPQPAANNTGNISAGIYINKGNGTIFRQNILEGDMTLLLNSNPNFSEGMRMTQSTNCLLECNTFKKTIYGLQVVGNCITGVGRVRGNKFNYHANSIHTLDNGAQGSLGDIGSFTSDPKNTFYNGSLATGANSGHIFRQSTLLFNRIYYNSLNYLTSNAPIQSARYGLQVISPGSFSCPAFLMALPETETNSFDEELAMQVVEDEIDYPEFPDIAKWIDELNIYSELYNNEALQNLNPDMQEFYDGLLNSPTYVITRTNEMMGKLVDTTVVQDSVSLENVLMDIANSNVELSGGNALEQNEYWANEMYIRWFRHMAEDFTETEQTQLFDLANSCPFVNGPSVYKARAMYASINPGYVFDDLGLCLAVGVYKQNSEPNYIHIDESKLEEINESNFLVYPNPASDQLNISYRLAENQPCQFILQDVTGRVVINIELDYHVEKMSIALQSIPKGLYVYQFESKGKTNQSGKLIIE